MIPPKLAYFANDLGGELTCRAKDEGLQLTSLDVDPLQDGQSESGGLPTSCLRLPHDIPAGEQGWNRLDLNRGGAGVTEVTDHGDQRW